MNTTFLAYSPARILVLLLACILTQVGCSTARQPAERTVSAGQWQRWEGALTAQKEHPQPYATVDVDVRFTGPDGTTLQVPAFWDGDRGFRFRAAFPSAGVWRWRATSNDPTDAGLHGQAGEVRVNAYIGGNPLYQHGDLRVSADKRYLVYADGTPFLWMGDTGWNVAWKSTAPEWQEYVDTRARQHFSVLQIVATGTVSRNSTTNPASGHAPFLDDGAPNPPFWRDLEEKLAYANDHGLIVVLVGVGKSPAGFAEQQRPPTFARYLAGRLAGHFVVFSPSMDQRYDEQNDETGTRLRSLTTHLVTQHPGTHFETARKYHDAAYADFCGLQTGHHGGNLNRAYEAAWGWTLELWQRPPVKPVINIEAMYDAHGHDNAPNWREQDVRKLGWIAWLSGSRGYTYGAGDIPPKVPAGAGGVWRFNNNPAAYDHWRKALRWPSAAQMTHLRDFFASIEWWRLEPAPDLVKNQAEDAPRKMVASRSPAGDLLVAYLPDNAEIVLDLKAMPAGLRGRWFNPVTGRNVPLEESLASQSAVTLHRPVGWNDAVLLLTKIPPANGATGVMRKYGDRGSDAERSPRVAPVVSDTPSPAAFATERPRLLVLTDYLKDPDEKQTMIRLLCYANEFEIEGLIATSLAYGDGSVRPELIKELIDDYAEVFPNLRKHERPGYPYPAPESLKHLVKAGAPVIRTFVGRTKGFEVPYPVGARDTRASDPAEKWIGPGKDTAGSEHIIQVVDRADSRPVWIIVWGGPMDLAQALWKVHHERTPEAAARFVRKLRVYQIHWQDTGSVWIWNSVPELFLIQMAGATSRGMYAEGPASLGNEDWVRENITQGHGRLGAGYPPANAFGKLAINVKEGDAPSFLHLLAHGLNDPEHPEWGGWGGRYQRLDSQRPRFVDGRDLNPSSTDPDRQMAWTVGRWKEAICNEFSARMDWCVRDRADANHPPIVHVDGDTTRNVLRRSVTAGQVLTLDAAGTHDPDGNAVAYHWWQYVEAGSFPAQVPLENANAAKVRLVAPAVSKSQTIHLILEVTDGGQPRLTGYRRAIVTISPVNP